MPADIIDRVHALARQKKAAPGLIFLDRNQAPDDNAFNDEASDSNDSDYAPSEEDLDYDSTNAYDDDDDGDDDGGDDGNDDDDDSTNDDDDPYSVPPYDPDIDGSKDVEGLDDHLATDASDSDYHPNSDSSDTDSYDLPMDDDYDSNNDNGAFPPALPGSAITTTTGVKTEEETQQMQTNDNSTVPQLKDDNYYPQDFYDEMVDDDTEPPESTGVGTHSDDDEPPESTGVAPQDNGNDRVEHQEELDHEMTVRYGPRTG